MTGPSFADVSNDVRQLLLLGDGWLDGEGEPVSPHVAEFMLHVIAGVADAGQAAPQVWPTVEGGVRAEWKLSTNEVVLEIAPSSPKLYAFSRLLGTSEVTELELDDGLSASDVAEKVAAMLGDSSGQ